MQKIAALLKTHWPVVVLILINAALFITNIKWGQFLLGWDVTAPELNPVLNFQRIIFGIWQQYRSLGTLDGMAHTANIVHWLYAAIVSLFLPLSLIRPTLLLLMHFFGGLGVYTLAFFLLEKKAIGTSVPSTKQTAKLIALLAALFYQFNFMTIQMFYLPLEVFMYHFVALPWGIFALAMYASKPSYRSLLLFALVNIATVGQAHVPSVFITYSLTLLFVGFGLVFTDWKKYLKPLAILAVVFLFVHAFWGFGYLYSATHKASEISNSKINQLSTEEIMLRNTAWGDWQSVLTFGGFNLDYHDWNQSTQQFELMMGSWQTTYDSPAFKTIALAFTFLALLGLIASLFFPGTRVQKGLVRGALVAGFFFFAMLAVDAFPVSFLSEALRAHVPFFTDVFRFTFTKFSLAYVCMLSICIAHGLSALLHWLRDTRLSPLRTAIVLLFAFGITYSAMPAFKGEFFYPRLWVSLPPSYSALQSYLSSQPTHQRVLLLPSPTLYGWTFNDWGHRGSGFVWQMLPQATTDRAFDAWSSQNEQLYTQLNFALASKDWERLREIIDQYDIHYLLFDESIFAPLSAAEPTNQQLLAWIQEHNLQPVWHDAGLWLFDASAISKAAYQISAPPAYTVIGSQSIERAKIDPYFEKTHHSYIGSNISDTSLPFSQLLGERVDADFSANTITIPSQAQQVGGTISLDGLHTVEYYNPPATIEFNQGVVSITFQSPASIVTSKRTLQLPALPATTITIDPEMTDIFLSLNGQIVQLTQNSNVTIQLTHLLPGQSVNIDVFDRKLAHITPEEITLDQTLAQRATIDASAWETALSFPSTQLDANEAVSSIVFNTVGRKNALDSVRNPQATNCDLLKRGKIHKEILDDGILYIASDRGSICESFVLYETSNHVDHLLVAEGNHTRGRNAKLFVENLGNHQLELEYLFADRTFDVAFPLLSKPNAPEADYRVGLETKSFGRESTENEFTKIQVYSLSLPIRFVSSIQITPLQTSANPVTIKKLKSYNPTFFEVEGTVTTDDSGEQNGLVVLSEGFENGWVAVNKNRPFEPLVHTSYNGWANSWLIPYDQQATSSFTLYIFYWPQLLVFLGYGLLFGGMGWLLLKATTRNKRSTSLSRVKHTTKQSLLGQ